MASNHFIKAAIDEAFANHVKAVFDGAVSHFKTDPALAEKSGREGLQRALAVYKQMTEHAEQLSGD